VNVLDASHSGSNNDASMLTNSHSLDSSTFENSIIIDQPTNLYVVPDRRREHVPYGQISNSFEPFDPSMRLYSPDRYYSSHNNTNDNHNNNNNNNSHARSINTGATSSSTNPGRSPVPNISLERVQIDHSNHSNEDGFQNGDCVPIIMLDRTCIPAVLAASSPPKTNGVPLTEYVNV
jgi:hypothetical protein